MSEQADWKVKYLDLSERLDTDAVRHAEAEKLLCRTIVRLTLATSGLDPQLDPHLKNLREAVHHGFNPKLEQQLEKLADTLVRAGDVAKVPQLIERVTDRLDLTDRDGKRLTRLWRELSRNPAAASDRELDEVIELLGIVSGESGRAASAGGLFGRLLRRDASASTPNAELRDLLERIDWPAQISLEINELIGSLGERSADDAWLQAVEQLSRLVVDALSLATSEVRAAESFLAELTRQLKELDDHVQANAALREASRASGRALDENVLSEAADIGRSVVASTDLGELRRQVAGHLEKIRAHVRQHLEGEEERDREATEREDKLRRRLESLEIESKSLRSQIADAHRHAMTDPVTGLPNRQAYEERIDSEFVRWKRFRETLVLMVWDVDNFKSINDRFGHAAGDKALRAIGSALRRRLRESDFLARYGGEEFVSILPGASAQDALRVAEDMRLAVASCGLHSSDKPITVTISCGLTAFADGDTPERVFERADKALYEAKRAGKNRCLLK